MTPSAVARYRRLVARALVVASIASLALTSSSTGATPCAEKILGDWLDNHRIDGIYELSCYDEAIAAVPPEIRDYADAEEVIARAPANATRRSGSTKPPSTPRDTTTVDDTGGTREATRAVGRSAPGAVPIPLIVLASMSLVLLISGALGYLSRRRREADAGDGT